MGLKCVGGNGASLSNVSGSNDHTTEGISLHLETSVVEIPEEVGNVLRSLSS